MALRRDKIDQRLARLERLANEQLEQVAQLREELGRGESSDDMWARMIYQVLSELERRGGSVPRNELLEIGQAAGYDRHGLAGYYQRMLRLENGMTYLTDAGRERLQALRARFGSAA